MNQAQDLLYSDDDEESRPSDDHNESTILLSTINGTTPGTDQGANAPAPYPTATTANPHSSDYGSLNSPTSSLGDSDYDRRESQYRTTYYTANNVDSKIGDQKLASILLAVILICSFSVAFLAGSSQVPGQAGNDEGGNTSSQNRMHYFPFPDGSFFSPGEGITSSLETSKYVPFKTIDRKDMGTEASQIVFPELFHLSLRLSKNSTKLGADDTSSSPLPLLKIPFPTVSFYTRDMF
jgi:hypothetical protein